MLEYVHRRPGYKFAYLTFNRQVMLEAQTKFPSNTACLNFHKLAYAKYGFVFKDKMLRGALRPHHAADALGIAKGDGRGGFTCSQSSGVYAPSQLSSEIHVNTVASPSWTRRLRRARLTWRAWSCAAARIFPDTLR